MSDGSVFGAVDTGSIPVGRGSSRRRESGLSSRAPDDVGRGAAAELVVELGLHTESNFFTGFSGSLADGGLFAQTYRVVEIGEAVSVLLSLPCGHETCVRGRVAWVRQALGHGSDLTPGVGIVFDHLTEADHQAIGHFMKVREPTFFDQRDSGGFSGDA